MRRSLIPARRFQCCAQRGRQRQRGLILHAQLPVFVQHLVVAHASSECIESLLHPATQRAANVTHHLANTGLHGHNPRPAAKPVNVHLQWRLRVDAGLLLQLLARWHPRWPT